MTKIKNMKKLLSVIGLLAVAMPASLSVVACGSASNETAKSPEQKIVDGIKKNERISLSDAFKDFKFKDSRDVKDVIDNNNLTNIKNQIQAFLGLEDLASANLILSNWKSNSIVLKAKSDSKIYKGKVTLAWNLKLFEIWAAQTDALIPELKAGLRGYFYLDINNQIRFCNVFTYKINKKDVQIHPHFNEYHSFEFLNSNNEQLKKYVFSGKMLTNEVTDSFGSVNFEPDMKVKVTSPERERVKIFQNDDWIGLKKDGEFIINNMGKIRIVK